MNSFFITGYPRSRTAWLANFFTYKNSFCFHDALDICEMDINKFPELFKSTKEINVGDSDSGVLFYADKIVELFDSPKFVLIERDFNDALVDLNNVFSSDMSELMNICRDYLLRFKKEYKPLVVPFEDLSDMSVCRVLWEYCLPTEEFNPQRFLMLDKIKMTINDKQVERLRRSLWQ